MCAPGQQTEIRQGGLEHQGDAGEYRRLGKHWAENPAKDMRPHDADGSHTRHSGGRDEQLLAHRGADATDWRISPLHADDLRGLPPAHIVVAEHDTLRDDGIRYAERLRAHEVPVRLGNYTGMAHGFLAMSLTPTMRRQALADIVGELKTAFSTR